MHMVLAVLDNVFVMQHIQMFIQMDVAYDNFLSSGGATVGRNSKVINFNIL